MIQFFRWVGLESRAQRLTEFDTPIDIARQAVIYHLQPLPDGLIDAFEADLQAHIQRTS